MKKTIEIDIDEVAKTEIASLRKKVTKLERQVDRLKDKNFRIEELRRFSKTDRAAVRAVVVRLKGLLVDADWAEYDDYYDNL